MESNTGNLTYHEINRRIIVANRRTENAVIHISLNPHPDDNLPDEHMTTIAQEYLERLGYGDQPYVIFKHTGTIFISSRFE